MGTPKITPGKWEAFQCDEYGTQCVRSDGKFIAEILRNKHAEANANLIAAAPELYEMLSSVENDNGCIPQGFWEKMQEVLRKARGEEA